MGNPGLPNMWVFVWSVTHSQLKRKMRPPMLQMLTKWWALIISKGTIKGSLQ